MSVLGLSNMSFAQTGSSRGILASPFLSYFGRRPVIYNRLDHIGQARAVLLPSMEDEPYLFGLSWPRQQAHFPYGLVLAPAAPVQPWEPYPWPWL